jgi:hypothetical protein
MNLPSTRPLNKVTYSALAAVLTALLFWALKRYAGIQIDLEGSALITTLVTIVVQTATAYLTPLSQPEVVQIVQSPEAPIQMPVHREVAAKT